MSETFLVVTVGGDALLTSSGHRPGTLASPLQGAGRPLTPEGDLAPSQGAEAETLLPGKRFTLKSRVVLDQTLPLALVSPAAEWEL